MVLDEDTYDKSIPDDLKNDFIDADGYAFENSVWYCKYFKSSFFFKENRLVGCCVSTTKPGDLACVALGSTYPFILRPDGDGLQVRGTHGIMNGEKWNFERRLFMIRR
jgi:hypothetical protein